jgi:hypothetical protein
MHYIISLYLPMACFSGRNRKSGVMTMQVLKDIALTSILHALNLIIQGKHL